MGIRESQVHAVQPAPEAHRPRHRARPVGPVRRPGPDLEVCPRAPPLGALPYGRGAGVDGGGPGPAGGLEDETPGRPLRGLQSRHRTRREAASGGVGVWRSGIPTTSRGRGAPPPAALRAVGRHNDVFPGEQAARLHNVAAPRGDRGGTLARRSRSHQPGLGRVGPARQRGDRMAPLRWGVRGSPGAASGGDGTHHVRDAISTRHRREDFTLTPQRRPGPVFRVRRICQTGGPSILGSTDTCPILPQP
jgi:hypothetical protein